MNLFFVVICKMDVAGVATASAISQYVSAGLILRDLFCINTDYRLHLSKLRPDPSKTIDILKIGIPSGLQNAIFALANLFVQVGVNSFSATMVAGNSAAANSDGLIYDVMAAIYTACASFMSQNLGAGKRPGIKELSDQPAVFFRHRRCYGTALSYLRKTVLISVYS